MAYLDDIINEIHAIKDNIYKFNDNGIKELIERIENVSFQGQVDHNVLYMAMLHQITNECTGELHTITAEEAEEFYVTGMIKEYHGWKPCSASFWFFDMDRNYVRAYISYNADMNKLPKENYGILYETLKPKVIQQLHMPIVYESLTENSEYAETWRKLKEIIKFGKNNLIHTGNFCRKVTYDTATYFGTKEIGNTSTNSLLDDEYKETARPELIKLPVSHKNINVITITGDGKDPHRNNLLSVINGPSYSTIDFETFGYIKSDFKKLIDLNAFMYSLIDYINNGAQAVLNGQKITCLEKHFFSNQIEVPADDSFDFENPDKTENTSKLDATKLYKISVTKFLNKIVIEAEVKEYGIYYKISNFNGKVFCDIV
jgi:hypothetical protein